MRQREKVKQTSEAVKKKSGKKKENQEIEREREKERIISAEKCRILTNF